MFTLRTCNGLGQFVILHLLEVLGQSVVLEASVAVPRHLLPSRNVRVCIRPK